MEYFEAGRPQKEIKSAVINNIFRKIRGGELTEGWIKCDRDYDIDINGIKPEKRKRVLTDLIGESLIYSSYGAEE